MVLRGIERRTGALPSIQTAATRTAISPISRQALLHPDRIKEISQYILNNYRQKTHRLQAGGKGFNAMFALSSVDAAKRYLLTSRIRQRERHRTQQHPAKNEPAESQVSHHEANRFPENRCFC